MEGIIHYKNSDGYEEWKEFNSNNQIVYFRDSSGTWWRSIYDTDGDITYHIDSNGAEEIYKYYNKY